MITLLSLIIVDIVLDFGGQLLAVIALLRQGELIAHQPTGELTRSLHLARPITVIVRRSADLLEEEAPSPADWEGELSHLPGATGATMDTATSARSDPLLTFVVDSLVLRATTPALLAWLRMRGLALESMRAEPADMILEFVLPALS